MVPIKFTDFLNPTKPWLMTNTIETRIVGTISLENLIYLADMVGSEMILYYLYDLETEQMKFIVKFREKRNVR